MGKDDVLGVRMKIYQNLRAPQVIRLIKHRNKMAYSPIVILVKKSSHIPLLEILIFLLPLSGVFRFFIAIFVENIGSLIHILLLNHFILNQVNTIIDDIFWAFGLYVALTSAMANRIFIIQVVLRLGYLIEVHVEL